MALREAAGRVFSSGIIPGYLISLVVASESLGSSPLGFSCITPRNEGSVVYLELLNKQFITSLIYGLRHASGAGVCAVWASLYPR